MLDAAPDCIKVVSVDGALLMMNKAGRRALNVPENSGFGMSWLDLLSEDVRPVGIEALRKATAGQNTRFPGKSRSNDETFYWDNLLTPVANSSGDVIAVLCISRDVTEKTLLEMQLADGGVVQIIHAFVIRKWGRSALWLLGGALYLLAGFSVFYDPLFATLLLTLMLGVSLGLSGLVRSWTATRKKTDRGRGWIIASGLCSLAAAVLIAVGWPLNSAWMLGLVLTIDLMFQGAALIFVGMSLKVQFARQAGLRAYEA